MLYNIWIDDMRKPPHEDNLIYFKDAESAIDWLINGNKILENDVIYFYLDHDLGENKKTGYDMAKFIVEYFSDKPNDVKYHLLTSNPVGAFNIRQLLTHYGFIEF